jgi:hypothetical protein
LTAVFAVFKTTANNTCLLCESSPASRSQFPAARTHVCVPTLHADPDSISGWSSAPMIAYCILNVLWLLSMYGERGPTSEPLNYSDASIIHVCINLRVRTAYSSGPLGSDCLFAIGIFVCNPNARGHYTAR